MKKLFLTLALILALVFAVTACNGNGGGDTPQGGSTDPDHTHVFDQKNTDKEYLKSKATRDEPAYYYYSCTCGARGTEVFVHGDSKENTLEPVFTLTDDSSFYTVTGLTGKGGVLEIPHMHDGLRVIAISANTFEGNTSIRKVVLPNTIELIGANAFKNCTELMEVELPDGSLATVDSYAFAGCTSLTSIDMPRKLKSLAEGAFQGCTALKSVTLSPGIETVGNLAFDGCTALTAIVLPDTVTTLGNMSFRHAEALASVQFSKSLTSIGNAAFQYCKSLTAVELHEGISVLGNSAFSYCTALKDLKIFGSITNFGNSSFYECTALESIYIAQSTPATVPAKNYIFYNAGTAGKGITFSYGCGTVLPTLLFVPNAEDNLPKITTRTVKHEYVYASNGTHHWQECIALGCGNKSTQEAHDFSGWVVDIPATCNATGIKHKACTVCEKTTGAEVTIPVDQSAHSYLLLSDDTYHWYKCQNAGCTSTKEKAIHVWNTEDLCATCFDHKDKGLVFLKQGDSYTVTKYTGTASKVIIPATYKGGTVTTIGAGAFADCKSLTSVTIPSTVTFVGAGAFDGCTSLKYAEYGNACYLGNTENPHHFLARVKDTSATCTIHENTGIIDLAAFNGCTGLKYTEYENALYLGSSKNPHFYLVKAKNVGIVSVTIHTNTKLIGAAAFEGCASLAVVAVPGGIVSIGDRAFAGCSNLSNVSFEENSALIHIGAAAFGDCTSLSFITLPFVGENKDGTGDATLGHIFGAGTEINATVPESLKTVVLMGGTKIGNGAFYGCSDLAAVVLPEGITSIGSYAFWGCSALANITVPNTVTTIGARAFYGCSGLTGITLGKNITVIDEYLFGNCGGLSSITLPSGVTSIGNYAFYGCSGLTGITLPSGVTSIGEGAFALCSGIESIAFPKTVTNIGAIALLQCTSLKTVTFAPCISLTTVSDRLFSQCTSLIEITIPDGVTDIRSDAFSSCTSLKSITLPNTVKSIGKEAFSHCEALVEIVLPEGVTVVAEKAFFCCRALRSVTFYGVVTEIGDYGFYGCSSLKELNFDSCTMSQINRISKGNRWDEGTPVDLTMYYGVY